MNPKLSIIETNHLLNPYSLEIRVSNVNVCFANAIRRTFLADIPTVVVDLDSVVVTENTTCANNEIIKDRLACVPFCVPLEYMTNEKISEFKLQVQAKNDTKDETIFVTPNQHFHVQRLSSSSAAASSFVDLSSDTVFPMYICPNGNSYPIEFIPLQAAMAGVAGQALSLTCGFKMDSAKTNGCYNVLSKLVFNNTLDPARQSAELERVRLEWKDELDKENVKEDEYEEIMAKKELDWKFLDGKRTQCCIPDSFDFLIESVLPNMHENCGYNNHVIVRTAFTVLIHRVKTAQKEIKDNPTQFIQHLSTEYTIERGYRVVLRNQDYTLGKMLEYVLLTMAQKLDNVVFVALNKEHPDDQDCFIHIYFHHGKQGKQERDERDERKEDNDDEMDEDEDEDQEKDHDESKDRDDISKMVDGACDYIVGILTSLSKSFIAASKKH